MGDERLDDVVIVGASAAGLSAADGLREGGYRGRITLVSSERRAPYDRPALSKALLSASDAPAVRELRTAAHFADQGLELRTGVEAVGLDVDRRNLLTADGEAIPWRALVIASGSRPRTLHTDEGAPLPTLRTPEDLAALRAAAARYEDITVVGAGFVGLEITASLRQRGNRVRLFTTTPLPLNEVVGAEVATHVRKLHLERGVDLRPMTRIVSVKGRPGDFEIRCADGATHRAEYVVAGIGAVPNVEWLVGSGLELGRGVITDAAGRTNVPGVVAVGDVADFEHPLYGERIRVEHWVNAVEQGRHVALNLARGTAVPYAAVPYFWTDQFERKYHCHGRYRRGDQTIVVEGSLRDDRFLALFADGEALHGVAASGHERSLRGYQKLLARGASLAEALAHAHAHEDARAAARG